MDGKWTSKMVIARIEEAARTIKRLPPVGPRADRAFWPFPTLDTYNSSSELRYRSPSPSPMEISQLDEVQEWMRWLAQVDGITITKLVWLRSTKMRWRVLAGGFGKPISTIRLMFDHAITRIAEHLNHPIPGENEKNDTTQKKSCISAKNLTKFS